jgi:hypothetical protein
MSQVLGQRSNFGLVGMLCHMLEIQSSNKGFTCYSHLLYAGGGNLYSEVFEHVARAWRWPPFDQSLA